MKTIYKWLAALLLFCAPESLQAQSSCIVPDNVSVVAADGYLNVSADLGISGLHLGRNRQLFVTPVLKGGDGETVALPSVLINGRNMHYAYKRGSLKSAPAVRKHDIVKEVRRINGKPQTIGYHSRIPLQKWMRLADASLEFVVDSCGCGALAGTAIAGGVPLDLNPVSQMKVAMMTPAVTDLPVSIHQGKARVQFEVDKTELHPGPYVCANGQKIDNSSQIRMIEDSIAYALSDPNVEIASIAICGYASPESPYIHNESLATERSRALAEYLADRYHLPHEKAVYSSVAENWDGFREEVLANRDITEQQRSALLELIDRPAYGAADYDAKEKELKTSPKFASLYKSRILPEWFPRLRATTFAITTRLRPMTDEQLSEVIRTSPEKMSLNQMFRVARLYPVGSEDFNKVIGIALEHYPDDPTANLNAMAAFVASGDYEKAEALTEKIPDSPELFNLKGIMATAQGNFDAAAGWFEKAATLPEAAASLRLIK